MTSSAAGLSRTDKNLWNAILGEAMAYLKYNAYAHRALEEGYPEVAQIFQEVAGAETIHGMNHLRVAGEIGSTAANLQQVTTSETKEFSAMYPRMIQDALQEDRQDAAESFALALERERHHQEAFSRALELLHQKQERLSEAAAATAVQATETPPNHGASALAATLPTGGSIGELDLQTYTSAAMEVDRERFRVANLGRLREVVFGAQDGILSTVALVTSIAVAVGENSTILVAGLAAALAGMISMATGAYLGSRAQQDVRKSEISREALELEERPEEEYAELVVIFQREGKTYQEARLLADDISQDKELWLNTLIEKELGISPEDTGNPVKDALTMGASFIVAAVIPIIPYLFLTGFFAIGISVFGGLIALFVLGMAKGRLVQRSPILQGLEILGIGVVSAGIGYLLGDLIPRLIT
ncbi:MAG TPA: VIT1/CCC1 transporter family protein [Dehalococcoidia bacterium]|nr:VIT1/CCC1 transporter family protein [Dehalococcoidia bacterium]